MNEKEKQLFVLEITDPDTIIERLQKMVLIAEDTDFTVEQSKILSPWLLNFAEKYKSTSDSQCKIAVYSAIRTGASMLYPKDIDVLIPLLKSEHLVTIKMIGRIFEAQPPKEIDQYENIAEIIYDIAEPLIKEVDSSSYRAAVTVLSSTALASIGSSREKQLITKIIEEKEIWFTKRCLHKLKELRHKWENSFKIEPHEPLKLLNESIYSLAEYIKEKEAK